MNKKQLNWITEPYFDKFTGEYDENLEGLSLLMTDLHASKVLTANKLFKQPKASDIIHGILLLLNSSEPKVASNACYATACFAESCWSDLFQFMLKENEFTPEELIKILCRLLHNYEEGINMNAAGALGAIAEHEDGRNIILRMTDFPQMINTMRKLLDSDLLSTSNNAALVFARLCLSDEGCQKVLKHPRAKDLVRQIIGLMKIDDAGRGINAAFALGRMVETKFGLALFLEVVDSDMLFSSLFDMMVFKDLPYNKNAAFCISCLATSKEGHNLLIESRFFDNIIDRIITLMKNTDMELAWFAALTISVIISRPSACAKLRTKPQLSKINKEILHSEKSTQELKEEIKKIDKFLQPLKKPDALYLEALEDGTTCIARWIQVHAKSGFQVSYELYCGDDLIYAGVETKFNVTDLEPLATYQFRVRVLTEIEKSPFSDPVSITMEESVPTAVVGLRALVITTSQIKICWEPPLKTHGVFKGYDVLADDKVIEHHFQETTTIISGLHADTHYSICVYGCTAKGRGEEAKLVIKTFPHGANAPSKPNLTVVGRSEISVSWEPPEYLEGRLVRYEVLCNKNLVYQGTDTICRVQGLTANTEYTFSVVALTSEGKFESPHSKKKTARDEYSDAKRAPLYQPRRPSMQATDISDNNSAPITTPRRASLPVKPRVVNTGQLSPRKESPNAKRRGSYQSTASNENGSPPEHSLSMDQSRRKRRGSKGNLSNSPRKAGNSPRKGNSRRSSLNPEDTENTNKTNGTNETNSVKIQDKTLVHSVELQLDQQTNAASSNMPASKPIKKTNKK